MPLWIWMYKYLSKSLLSLLLGMYPEVELLDQVVILHLIFWGTTVLFSVAVSPFYILTSISIRVLVFLYPCQHLLSFLLRFYRVWGRGPTSFFLHVASKCKMSVPFVKKNFLSLLNCWNSYWKSVALKCISGLSVPFHWFMAIFIPLHTHD